LHHELTPFHSLFLEQSNWEVGGDYGKVHGLIRIWLEDLMSAGVDLLEYGRNEKAIHARILKAKPLNVLPLTQYYWRGCQWDLLDFTFGPSPGDWRVWLTEPTDRFAGEFWSMIEPPEAGPMPGMWID